MSAKFVFAVMLAALSSVHAQSPKGFDLPRAAEVVDQAHSAGTFDGVVILSQNGRPLLTKAVGLADRQRKRPNTPETVFRLASLTKQITALLVMQQVASKRIALDQPTGEILPALSPQFARITVRQLLQHTSGLVNPSDGPDDVVPPFYLRTAPSEEDLTAGSLGFCSQPAKREPGASFEYNNCDYIVLGAILEHVTGLPYSKLVEKRVIQPLGLRSWGIFPSKPATPEKAAPAYQTDGSPDAPQNPATYGPAGALYGNALDVARWNDALLNHKLLSAEATDIMFQASPKLYGEALGSWSYDLPGASPTLHLVERQGDIGGLHLLNLLLPAQNASLILIANTERADLFNTYSQKGLGYAILKAALIP